MTKIFCVEDDNDIRELIEYTLKAAGFSVSGFDCGDALFSALKKEMPDLILLDIMLPGMDGMSILRCLRGSHDTAAVPVIMLTAKGDRIDKIKGLESGADDYITKPFDILELIARIKAVLRRGTAEKKEISVITCGDITVDCKRRRVTSGGRDVTLTYKEYEMLLYMMNNKGSVVSRSVLLDKIWNTDFEGESRTVDVHIRTLRQKLGDAGKCIETVRNVGYRMCENV